MKKFWKNTIAESAGPEYALGCGFTMVLLSIANIEEKLK